jgi:predicted peptidase
MRSIRALHRSTVAGPRCKLAVFLLACVPAIAAGAEKEPPSLERRVYTDPQGKRLPYRLLQPQGYDPARKYPLVLFLHGGGERGNDNEKQLVHVVPEFLKPENRRRFPCFLIAPQSPEAAGEVGWVAVDWRAASYPQPKEPAEPLRLALELVTALQKEFSIDARRLYVTGLSAGGFGTWDAIARRPDLFAAAVPICGGGDPTKAARFAKVPVWVFHGAKDKAMPPSKSQVMVEALRAAGGHPRYTEYPDEGHNCWTRAFREPELWAWLFAQRRE